jgi:tRNA threonylcarbamoyladenosine modification (KEOPS) complex  Pcc1 subunit
MRVIRCYQRARQRKGKRMLTLQRIQAGSVLLVSLLAYQGSLSASIANLSLAIICLTYNLRAADIAAFRFFIYSILTWLFFKDASAVEYYSNSLLTILVTFTIIDFSFLIKSRLIKSPTRLIYLLSVCNMCITSILWITIEYFPETTYNILNAGMPVLLIGALTYEGFSRVR